MKQNTENTGADYIVAAGKGQSVVWGILALMMFGLSALPVALALHEIDMLRQTWGLYAFILAFFLLLAVCAVVRCISLARPVAEVYGDRVVYRTGKGKKAEISIDEITARISTPAVQQNPVVIGGLMGYLLYGGKPAAAMTYRYKSNGRELFSISSTMKNADRLDSEIYSRIKEKEETPVITGE